MNYELWIMNYVYCIRETVLKRQWFSIFLMKDCVSVKDFSRKDLDFFVEEGLRVKESTPSLRDAHPKKILAALFFENSTRTKESHTLAAYHLGMNVVGFAGIEGTSVKKGEPLADTLRMYAGYGADIVVMRHGLEGAARFAADLLEIPVINGGDGSNGHPTQTLLDLMTIKESLGRLDNFSIALVGDLKYGRTVHSLLHGLSLCQGVEVALIAPETLQMPQYLVESYEKSGKKVQRSVQLRDGLKKDFLYMTRIQRERFPEGPEGDYEYHKVSGIYRVDAALLQTVVPHLKVLHALPRNKKDIEIALDVDQTKHALYLEQARNGLFLRIALLDHLLREQHSELKQDAGEEKLWEALPIHDGRKQGERLLYRLDDGTLIDHIEAGKGLEVYRILGLSEAETEVVTALNIKSQQYGNKDVLAIHNVRLSPEQLWKLALISETATVNIISEQQVIQKGKVLLPAMLGGLVQCTNQRCVSVPEHKEYVPSKFRVLSPKPLSLECYYCEKPVGREEIVIY